MFDVKNDAPETQIEKKETDVKETGGHATAETKKRLEEEGKQPFFENTDTVDQDDASSDKDETKDGDDEDEGDAAVFKDLEEDEQKDVLDNEKTAKDETNEKSEILLLENKLPYPENNENQHTENTEQEKKPNRIVQFLKRSAQIIGLGALLFLGGNHAYNEAKTDTVLTQNVDETTESHNLKIEDLSVQNQLDKKYEAQLSDESTPLEKDEELMDQVSELGECVYEALSEMADENKKKKEIQSEMKLAYESRNRIVEIRDIHDNKK